MDATTADPAITPTTSFPTFRKIGMALARWTRLPRRILLSKTSFKVYVLTASAIALTYNGLRWYGRRALAAEQERVAALGLATDWKDLELPMPPEADNFWESPVFKGIIRPPYSEAPQLCLWLGWRLPALKQSSATPAAPRPRWLDAPLADWCAYFRGIGTLPENLEQWPPAQELLRDHRREATIAAIYDAAQRPESLWPEPVNGGTHFISTPRTDFRRMALGILIYARANLETGNVGRALPAFRVFRHLTVMYATGGVVASGMASYSLQIQKCLLLEGIAAHQLPTEILTAILSENYPEIMRKAARRSVEVKRVGFLEGIEADAQGSGRPLAQMGLRNALLTLVRPDYYWTRKAVFRSQYDSEFAMAMRPLTGEDTWASRMGGLSTDRGKRFGDNPDQQKAFDGVLIHPVISATLHHLAAALELHYLQHGRYPADLSGLETGLSSFALRDADGKPFAYSTDTSGAHFALSSAFVKE